MKETILVVMCFILFFIDTSILSVSSSLHAIDQELKTLSNDLYLMRQVMQHKDT